MNNVYLQLDTRNNTLKLPVMDASDLRYAISSMWEACGNTGTFGRYIDLVHEDGKELTEEEREAFFDEEISADCEIALGDCWLSADIQFEEALDEEQKVRIFNIADSIPHNDFCVFVYNGQLTLQTRNNIHFTSYPNKHARFKSARYEYAECDARSEAKSKIEAINKLLETIAERIKNELGIELELVPFDGEWFNFDEESYGDYKIVNLKELYYDYISF